MREVNLNPRMYTYKARMNILRAPSGIDISRQETEEGKIHIYIYMCVCVCEGRSIFWNQLIRARILLFVVFRDIA